MDEADEREENEGEKCERDKDERGGRMEIKKKSIARAK